MQRLYETYQEEVAFFLVYIREAHPDSVLYVEQEDGQDFLQLIRQTETLQERSETALACSATLDLSIPTLVDTEDNAVSKAYAAWPDRLVVVGRDGRIAYYGREGPRGFKPHEVEQWLREHVSKGSSPATTTESRSPDGVCQSESTEVDAKP